MMFTYCFQSDQKIANAGQKKITVNKIAKN